MKKGKGLNRRKFLKVAANSFGIFALSSFSPNLVLGQEKPSSLIIGTQGGDWGKLTRKYIDGPFEEKYGVEVKHFTSKHPERLVKLRAEVPNPSFDVYFSKVDFLIQAANLGLIETISSEGIPNYEDVFPIFRSMHFVGQIYTAEGILYNPKAMKKPNSWAVLWDPQYKGKIALSQFVGRSLMMCSLYATGGKEVNNEEKAWEALEALVLEQKAKPTTSSEQLGTMFEQGEIVMAPYWLARAYQWKKAGFSVEFASPKEGSIAEFWGYGIPKGVAGAKKEYAGKWIARAIGPEVGLGFAREIFYPSCNRKAEYPPELEEFLLKKDEFDALVAPDHLWVWKNIEKWTERYNKLLSR